MAKTNPVPRLNQVLALLVKGKASQSSVANALEISSQSLGYYMRGRKIPTTVIEKWQEVFGQNLIELSKMDFETDIDALVTLSTQVPKPGKKQSGTHQVEEPSAAMLEMFRELQKSNERHARDNAMHREEIARLWTLVHGLMSPQVTPQPVKRIKPDKGK